MFTLTFQKSKSPAFQKALEIAESLGATFDGETVHLEVPTERLLCIYNDLMPLLEIVHSWKSLRGTFRGKRVRPYPFIFFLWRNIRECCQAHDNTTNHRHCWYGIDSPGWGCKFLNRIFRDPQGPGNYKTSNKYWYNFGSFDQNGQWIINKDYIRERIIRESNEKALDTCPYFNIEKIIEAVQNLPESVEIDNLHFKKYYISEYEDGRKIEKAVNIRHLKIETDPPDLRKMIAKYDYLKAHYSIN